MRGVSLAHPELASFLCGECLLHIPCWLYLSVGSFSYTLHASSFFRFFFSFFFIFFIPCSLFFPLFFFFFFKNFSYTFHAGFFCF